MIVKNESHIIEKTLTNLCSKIKFDYWVICDTGSTDDTINIIKNFFIKENIPGSLHETPWVDFAHNRTLALNYAFNKTDLLLIFDADDTLIGQPDLPKTVDHDGYDMIFKNATMSYNRTLLVCNRLIWIFKGVLHEYIECKTPKNGTVVLRGDYHIESGRNGARNTDPNKYANDARILESAYHRDKSTVNELSSRYAFYCANSYHDADSHNNAIKWYKITLNENGWNQEKYVSCLKLFHLYDKRGQKETGFYYLVKSSAYDRERVECIYHLIVHYCVEGMNEVANGYYNLIKKYYETIYLNTNIHMQRKLFINVIIHDFYLPYYMIIVADRIKDRPLGIKMYEMIFTKKPHFFAEWWINNLIGNFQFFINHLCDVSKKRIIDLANNYLKFLADNGVQLNKFTILKNYEIHGIITNYIFTTNKEVFEEKCIN